MKPQLHIIEPDWDDDADIKALQLRAFASSLDRQLASIIEDAGGNPSFFEDCVKSTVELAMQG